MNEGKKLVLARGIFTFFVVVAFGLIIVKEKQSTILLPRVKEQINNYIEENYKNITNDVNIGDVIYKTPKYTVKVTSKENNNYYFYIDYENKNITDSYQQDYIEGKTLLDNIKNELETEIKNETNENCTINIIASLDKYTSQVRERIIKEDNLKELKFYSINFEIEEEIWNEKEITKSIVNTLKIYNSNNINPKYYTITITNKKDITQSIEITNITNDFITNIYQEQIIKDILNDKNTQLLQTSKITYKYLN